MIFDVKMEDFHRKVQLVSGGHIMDVPPTIIHASVVSHETVLITLTMAVLNAFEVVAADILNMYITALNKEKIWTLLGPEFDKDKGHNAIVVRALYGLKSAGAAFRRHLADCMRQLGYESNKADQDLWMKVDTQETKNGPKKYYSYILIYVDDILCIHYDPDLILTQIDKYFPFKPDSVGELDVYFTANISDSNKSQSNRFFEPDLRHSTFF